MMNKMKIGLFGAIGIPNVGDEAILEANLLLLEKQYKNRVEVYIFTKDASFTNLIPEHKYISVHAISYLHEFVFSNLDKIKEPQSLLEIFNNESQKNIKIKILNKIFRELDAFQFIGGGYFSSFWPDVIVEAGIAASLLKKYNIPYILTGQSTYLIDNFDRKIFERILANANFADFREKPDKYFLAKYLNVFQTLDDAICLPYQKKEKESKEFINIIIHPWREYNQIIQEKIVSVIVPFIDEQIKDNFNGYFNILSFSEEDTCFWKELMREDLCSLEKIHFINCVGKDSKNIKALFDGALYTITSRFHAAVFSLSMGIPTIAVCYDKYYYDKFKSVYNLFNDDNFVNIEKFKVEDLKSFILNQEIIRKNLHNRKTDINGIYQSKVQKIVTFYDKYLLDESNIAISVIIPIYNMGAYLSQCLDSVLKQSLTNIEIICVNDGSTDNSQSVLNEYKWKNYRITVIQQENQGVSRARNNGLRKATGKYVFFLDPDDWLPDNEVLADLYFAAEKHNVYVCGGGFEESREGILTTQWYGSSAKYVFRQEGYINYRDYQYDYGWVRFIYNRNFLIENSLYIPNLSFFEDPVFFVNVMHKAKVFYALTRMTYCYRSGHHSHDLSYKKVLDLIDGLTQNIRIAKENGYKELLQLELDRIKQDYAFQIAKYLRNDKDSLELNRKINRLNLLLGNNSQIEYDILQSVISNLQYQVWLHSSGKQVLKEGIKRRAKKSMKVLLPNIVINYLKKWRKKNG